MNRPSLLGQLTAGPLEKPCDEPWDQMKGDARVRHCDACQHEVFFVSAMSKQEAEVRLLNAAQAVPCIRYARLADGTVEHAPSTEARALPTHRLRSMVAATTLGATLASAAAAASDPVEPDAPEACVAYAEPPEKKEAPAAEKTSQKTANAKMAKPSPMAAAPVEEPKPRELGGKPMRPQERPAFGTLVLKSKVSRSVTIIGITLTAPLSSYRLTPGSFSAEVRDPDGKVRKVRFKIEQDKPTVVDLDAR